MNHVTVGAGALTKRTTCNSRQTKQTATNQQHATLQAATDKQCRIDAQQHAPTQATHKARRAQTSAHAQPQQTTSRAKKQGNPATAPNRHSHGASRHRLRPSADTHGNHTIPKQGIARSRPARDSTSSGQTVDKREIPEYPQREHPPTRRDNHANTVQTRKREKPTPHPPEQRRGKPQQTGA